MPQPEYLHPLRIGAAAACGLTLLEAALFSAAGMPVSGADFIFSILAGLALAVIWWAGLSIFKKYSGHPGDVSRVTSLAVPLALLYLILAEWFATGLFNSGRRLLPAAALAILLGIIIALGRTLYIYFPVRGPDLAKARFQALTPVAVVCAALYSVVRDLDETGRLTPAGFSLTVLVLILLLAAGQYAGIRMIWGGRRDKWRRAGLRIQYLCLAVMPILAAVLFAHDRWQASRPDADPGAPPIILITVDALRADFVSALNPKAAPTPAIDRLAADGIVFEHAMAASNWTSPSLAAMLTGLPPAATGAGRLVVGGTTGPDASVPMLAEVLRSQGYYTVARVENPWLQVRDFDRGFDDFQEGMSRPRPEFLLARSLLAVADRLQGPLPENAAGLTELALSWLRSRPRGPFFLWLHYIDPHLPYYGHAEFPVPGGSETGRLLATDVQAWRLYLHHTQPTPADIAFVTGRYRGEVLFTDRYLGHLFDQLRMQGLYDQAVIVLTADHGEELFDHADFEHGHSFYDEVLHVPLIIKLPGNGRAGARVSEWESLTRLPATLADAAGLPAEFGASLLSCRSEKGCPGKGTVSWRAESTLYAGDWGADGTRDGIKIIQKENNDRICFDLNFDPGEMVPLPLSACPSTPLVSAPPPDHSNILPESSAAPKVSEDTRRRLRALGYVQ